jgi:hypothetical protein
MRVRDNCGSCDCGEVALLSEGKCVCCEDKLSIKTILNSDDALRAKQKERKMFTISKKIRTPQKCGVMM